jgi:excisionase family DNA binding protein
MNLVDAIRKATNQRNAQAQPYEPVFQAHGEQDSASVQQTEDVTAFHCNTQQLDQSTAFILQQNPNMNLVKLEVFLSPEQTQALLRGTLATNKSVMTAREVAHYLRIDIATVEQLAKSGKLPSFDAEGHTRFQKTAIDQWISAQSTVTNKESENAA